MKLAVIFPSVMYREGPPGIKALIQGIEAIGFDELNMFDHVVMGHPTETRRAPVYSPTMPIMEAFMMLSFAAAITQRLCLATGVLVLPQRQPTLVAKQVSSLDTLSGGRMKLGVGVGWQRSEYEALGESFESRGARFEEAITLMRRYWQDEHVVFDGTHYQADDIAMEPKPPQGGRLPIWMGGTKDRALKRIARIGDGWMAMNAPGDEPLADRLSKLRRFAEEAERDPKDIGLQMLLAPDKNSIHPLSKEERKRFFVDTELMRRRAVELQELGFDHLSIDCVPIFQAGHRTSTALLDQLQSIHNALAPELDK